jgi:hypothetical protein
MLSYISGTSAQGKVHITKMGSSLIRGKFSMYRFTARKFKAACKALYDRLITKSKNEKVALIAVCNKPLKQAFGIVKIGVPYQVDSTLNLPVMLDF